MTSINTVLERERTPVYLIHLAPLLNYIIPTLGHIIGALIVWLLTRDVSKTVDQQGKRALNFQLTLGLFFLVLWIIVFMTFFLAMFFLWPLFVAIYILQLITMILAVIATNEGRTYNYPLSIQFLR
jgi:uncharacterized protein